MDLEMLLYPPVNGEFPSCSFCLHAAKRLTAFGGFSRARDLYKNSEMRP